MLLLQRHNDWSVKTKVTMEQKVFITKTASYFPNEPVENEEMEDYLGLIGGKPSRVKNIILHQNGRGGIML